MSHCLHYQPCSVVQYYSFRGGQILRVNHLPRPRSRPLDLIISLLIMKQCQQGRSISLLLALCDADLANVARHLSWRRSKCCSVVVVVFVVVAVVSSCVCLFVQISVCLAVCLYLCVYTARDERVSSAAETSRVSRPPTAGSSD